jgi:hypothetical protein
MNNVNQGGAILSCLLVVLGCSSIGRSQGHSQSELRSKLQEKGSMSVLVRLSIPWKPESALPNDLVAAQRQRIAIAQKRLVDELKGTTHTVIMQSERFPDMVLEVGTEALDVLLNSALVEGVSENVKGGLP